MALQSMHFIIHFCMPPSPCGTTIPLFFFFLCSPILAPTMDAYMHWRGMRVGCSVYICNVHTSFLFLFAEIIRSCLSFAFNIRFGPCFSNKGSTSS